MTKRGGGVVQRIPLGAGVYGALDGMFGDFTTCVSHQQQSGALSQYAQQAQQMQQSGALALYQQMQQRATAQFPNPSGLSNARAPIGMTREELVRHHPVMALAREVENELAALCPVLAEAWTPSVPDPWYRRWWLGALRWALRILPE